MRPTEPGRGAVAAILIVVMTWMTLAWASRASAAELAEDAAQRALKELDYADARAILQRALETGGLSRERLIAVRALLGEVVAAMDGPEAGEREFRRLLVLDPQRPTPSKKSPVIVAPFERARRWVAQNGSLKATPVTLGALEVEARVTADPLAMAAGARVYAGREEAELARVPGSSLRATLPSGARLFYIEVIDEQENVLSSTGLARRSLRAAGAARREAALLRRASGGRRAGAHHARDAPSAAAHAARGDRARRLLAGISRRGHRPRSRGGQRVRRAPASLRAEVQQRRAGDLSCRAESVVCVVRARRRAGRDGDRAHRRRSRPRARTSRAEVKRDAALGAGGDEHGHRSLLA